MACIIYELELKVGGKNFIFIFAQHNYASDKKVFFLKKNFIKIFLQLIKLEKYKKIRKQYYN